MNFLQFEDKLYTLQRIIYESHNPNIATWREHLRSDKVLKKEGMIYFLAEVTDMEFEDIKEEEPQTILIEENENIESPE